MRHLFEEFAPAAAKILDYEKNLADARKLQIFGLLDVRRFFLVFGIAQVCLETRGG